MTYGNQSAPRVLISATLEAWFADYARFRYEQSPSTSDRDTLREWRLRRMYDWPEMRNTSRKLAEAIEKDSSLQLDSSPLWRISGEVLPVISAETWDTAWILCNKLKAKVDAETIHPSTEQPARDKNQDEGPWSTPDSPSRWAKFFGFSLDTLKRRISDGRIRVKTLSSKSYQVHVDDLPKQTSNKPSQQK